MKKLLVILVTAVVTFSIYWMIILCISLSYFIVYRYTSIEPERSNYFGRTLWLYYDYILPYPLIVTNLMLVFVKYKTVNRIAVVFIHLGVNLWYWIPSLSSWPYRLIPALSIITVFYLLDILIVRFIVKKLLQRTIL